MSSPTELPSFFGRATAVLGEHARLHVMLAELRSYCAGQSAARASPDLEPLLGEFVSLLAEHFAAEEDAGYFGTLRAASPSSAAAVARLRAEHTALLEVARTLRARARDRAHERAFTELLGAMLDDLGAHERSESELVRHYLAEAEL